MNGFRLTTWIDLELIERTAIHRSKLSETGTRDVTLQKRTANREANNNRDGKTKMEERKKTFLQDTL